MNWDPSAVVVKNGYKILLGRLIGEGTYAKVVEGIHIASMQRVAVKVCAKISEKREASIRREIEVMKRLNGHPNVVRLYDVIEEEKAFFIIMEFVEDNLLLMMDRQASGLSEMQAKKIFTQLVDVMSFLHTKQVVHLDVKLENILWDPRNQRICLCDFGMSQFFEEDKTLKGICGSFGYVAPEVLLNKSYNGITTDTYSMGVVLYTLVFKCFPFDDRTPADRICAQLQEANNPDAYGRASLDLSMRQLTPELQDLLHQLLTKDVSKRLTIRQVRKHPWLRKPSLLERLFSMRRPYVLNQRPSF